MATTTVNERSSTLDRPLLAGLALDWEKTLYVALIIAALVTRFYDLGVRVMSHDESLHTQFSWYLFKNGNFQHDPVMHGPLKFEVTAFVYWLLGDNDFTARIPTAVMGVVAVGLMYFFRKWLGRTGALIAAFLILISPYQLYYARYIRDEAYVVVWGLLLALCIFNYMESRSVNYLYGLAVVTALFYATMETSFIYVAIAMLFLGIHFALELSMVEWPNKDDRRNFLIVLIFGLFATLVGVGLFLYSDRLGLSGTAFTPSTVNPEDPGASGATQMIWADIAWLLALGCGVGALYFVARAFGKGIRRFASLDLIIILGVFALPQLTAFPVKMLGFNPINYTPPLIPSVPYLPELGFFERLGVFLQNVVLFFQNLPMFINSDVGVTLLVTLLLLGVSLVIGWVWNLPVFLVCAAIFYGIYIPLYTTFFTKGGGLATGLIGSLGYWLDQHSVRRGSQPWYFYGLIQLPVYEYLPTLGMFFAAALGLRRFLKPPDTSTNDEDAENSEVESTQAPVLRFPVLAYIGYWCVMAFAAFSIAGEKMPWLTTHIVLPFILISGWALGQFVDAIDWKHFRARRAWLVAILLPITLVALATVLATLLGATPPAAGGELPEAQAATAFVSALIVAAIGGFGLYRLGAPLGWSNVARLGVLTIFGLLALLTIRTAFVATYVNYDYANEYLVYAHGSRGVKTVMEQVEDISVRTTDSLEMKVAYDAEVSWPVTWYMRNFKNQSYYAKQPTREALDAPVVIAGADWPRIESLLGDRYYQFEYIRMVWPMQDYFDMTFNSVLNGLILAPASCHQARLVGEAIPEECQAFVGGLWSNAQYRQALWNIWFNRDYTLYGQLRNKRYDLSVWDPADRMRMYVRKDVAAEIWQYGVGPAQVAGSLQEDPYAKSRQTLTADVVIGGPGQADGQFDGPRGVATAPDGSVYVTDARNHRIQKFTADGQLVKVWGAFGKTDDNTAVPGAFNEPWGVGVGPDGAVYVADTWNHRIQKFDADGNFITMWGQWGQGEDLNALYGPRAVAVDAEGRVYVADTGNKRVVVFDENGEGLAAIGSGGFEPGFLDEPVGVAVGPDGTVYVADTWNQRVQAFRRDNATGQYLFDREIKLSAWYGAGGNVQSLDNKPYLAVDALGRLYVTDPEGYRVLVFDGDGAFRTTWGDFGNDATTFSNLAGIAVNSDGQVYVMDVSNSRVMRFPALAP